MAAADDGPMGTPGRKNDQIEVIALMHLVVSLGLPHVKVYK